MVIHGLPHSFHGYWTWNPTRRRAWHGRRRRVGWMRGPWTVPWPTRSAASPPPSTGTAARTAASAVPAASTAAQGAPVGTRFWNRWPLSSPPSPSTMSWWASWCTVGRQTLATTTPSSRIEGLHLCFIFVLLLPCPLQEIWYIIYGCLLTANKIVFLFCFLGCCIF